MSCRWGRFFGTNFRLVVITRKVTLLFRNRYSKVHKLKASFEDSWLPSLKQDSNFWTPCFARQVNRVPYMNYWHPSLFFLGGGGGGDFFKFMYCYPNMAVPYLHCASWHIIPLLLSATGDNKKHWSSLKGNDVHKMPCTKTAFFTDRLSLCVLFNSYQFLKTEIYVKAKVKYIFISPIHEHFVTLCLFP